MTATVHELRVAPALPASPLLLARRGERRHCRTVHGGRISHRWPCLVGKRPPHYRHVTRQLFMLADPTTMLLTRFAFPKHTDRDAQRRRALES